MNIMEEWMASNPDMKHAIGTMIRMYEAAEESEVGIINEKENSISFKTTIEIKGVEHVYQLSIKKEN